MYDHRDEKVKREATLPVQTRVDFRCLATLDGYLRKNGVYVSSMSQLVSMGIDALIEILKVSGGISREEEVISITDAVSVLEQRGLTQSALMKRSGAKMHKALRFEELRLQDIDPESYAPGQYKQIHNTKVSKVIRTTGDKELLEIGRGIMKRMGKGDRVTKVEVKVDELGKGTLVNAVLEDKVKTTVPSIARQRSKEEIEADRVAKDKAEEEKLKGLDEIPTEGLV